MMPHSRRKKWSEAEERTLIDRYGEMVSDGTLAKMKTREKKFKPIALYVNSIHHARDSASFPWQWTWKDVSTKVQNMRHQYLLVKQKIKKPESMVVVGSDSVSREEFEWDEGVSHWSNFLRYKEVFGDVPLLFNREDDVMAGAAMNDENGGGFDGGGRVMEMPEFGHFGHSREGDFAAGIDGGDTGVLGLGFQYNGEDGEENFNGSNHLKEDGDDGFVYEEVEVDGSESKKKRKRKKMSKGLEKKAWVFLANQLGQLREMENQFELRETERERERQRREHFRMENERNYERRLEEREKEREEREKNREKLRKQRMQEWEAMEKESEERERGRREELLIQEREWEERMKQRRIDWKKRTDAMLSHHRAELGQIQSRMLHEQQNLIGQLLGVVSQWTGHPTGLSDHTGASSHYLSQMMQSLHHVNGMVHDDARGVEGDHQDDQFIVDG